MTLLTLKCEFSICASTGYECRIKYTPHSFERGDEIHEFNGKHKEGKSNEDVTHIYFFRRLLNYFPRGLEKHFPNLTHLEINECKIKEISRNDLKGLEGLVQLMIDDTRLKSLPDDLFTEMPNLKIVSFYENKIVLTSSKFLKPLLGRENVLVDLRKNKNIDACFWPGDEGSTESLEELMKLIDEKCIKDTFTFVPDVVKLRYPKKIKEMWLTGDGSDLTIIAGEKKFKVHKKVLKTKSEVFAQIIEHQSEAAEIKISDFSPKSVENLLRFIYTSEVTKKQNAKENFEIANNFKVEPMKLHYEKVIYSRIDDGNAWDTFMFAHRFASQSLKEKAFQQIISKIPDEVPVELMEDPESLKKLIEHRKAYEDTLTDK